MASFLLRNPAKQKHTHLSCGPDQLNVELDVIDCVKISGFTAKCRTIEQYEAKGLGLQGY